MSEARPIRLRYPAVCSSCTRELPVGAEAFWSRSERAATCLECPGVTVKPAQTTEAKGEPPALDRGVAGRSGRRQHAKRRERREQHARQRLGRFSGAYLALTDEPQSTRAWEVGAVGEERLGTFLDTLDDDRSLFVLHDRRIPGSRANIDHIVISAGGVFVVDAKHYRGAVRRADKGGWLSTDYRLFVGRRDCTKLITGMAKQMTAVREALGGATMQEFELRLTPVLCFVDAEWSLFAKPFQVGGVWVEWPRSLAQRIQRPGALEPQHVRALAKMMAASLPKA